MHLAQRAVGGGHLRLQVVELDHRREGGGERDGDRDEGSERGGAHLDDREHGARRVADEDEELERLQPTRQPRCELLEVGGIRPHAVLHVSLDRHLRREIVGLDRAHLGLLIAAVVRLLRPLLLVLLEQLLPRLQPRFVHIRQHVGAELLDEYSAFPRRLDVRGEEARVAEGAAARELAIHRARVDVLDASDEELALELLGRLAALLLLLGHARRLRRERRRCHVVLERPASVLVDLGRHLVRRDEALRVLVARAHPGSDRRKERREEREQDDGARHPREHRLPVQVLIIVGEKTVVERGGHGGGGGPFDARLCQYLLCERIDVSHRREVRVDDRHDRREHREDVDEVLHHRAPLAEALRVGVQREVALPRHVHAVRLGAAEAELGDAAGAAREARCERLEHLLRRVVDEIARDDRAAEELRRPLGELLDEHDLGEAEGRSPLLLRHELNLTE